MAKFKCKMCGDALEIADGSVCVGAAMSAISITIKNIHNLIYSKLVVL